MIKLIANIAILISLYTCISFYTLFSSFSSAETTITHIDWYYWGYGGWARDMWAASILPSLLNNSDIWIDLNKESTTKLENIQNSMFRNLFWVPSSTPLPLLRFDVGSLTMGERVHKKKLNFLFHLKSIECESLGGEIMNLQIKYGFPGLVTLCRELIKM